jgi:hypothetical protein
MLCVAYANASIFISQYLLILLDGRCPKPLSFQDLQHPRPSSSNLRKKSPKGQVRGLRPRKEALSEAQLPLPERTTPKQASR